MSHDISHEHTIPNHGDGIDTTACKPQISLVAHADAFHTLVSPDTTEAYRWPVSTTSNPTVIYYTIVTEDRLAIPLLRYGQYRYTMQTALEDAGMNPGEFKTDLESVYNDGNSFFRQTIERWMEEVKENAHLTFVYISPSDLDNKTPRPEVLYIAAGNSKDVSGVGHPPGFYTRTANDGSTAERIALMFIETAQVTPTSEQDQQHAFYVHGHELLHTLGLSHPGIDPDRDGAYQYSGSNLGRFNTSMSYCPSPGEVGNLPNRTLTDMEKETISQLYGPSQANQVRQFGPSNPVGIYTPDWNDSIHIVPTNTPLSIGMTSFDAAGVSNFTASPDIQGSQSYIWTAGATRQLPGLTIDCPTEPVTSTVRFQGSLLSQYPVDQTINTCLSGTYRLSAGGNTSLVLQEGAIVASSSTVIEVKGGETSITMDGTSPFQGTITIQNSTTLTNTVGIDAVSAPIDATLSIGGNPVISPTLTQTGSSSWDVSLGSNLTGTLSLGETNWMLEWTNAFGTKQELQITGEAAAVDGAFGLYTGALPTATPTPLPTPTTIPPPAPTPLPASSNRLYLPLVRR
jgi:hypothetical protein